MTRFFALLASTLALVLVPAAMAAAGEVKITSGPEGPTNEALPVFTFTATDEAECRLDNGPWVNCADEFRAPRLADGGHIFVARLKDRSANDIRSFTVDTVVPTVTLDATEAEIADTTATVTFAAEDGATVTCAIDSEPAQPCTTPWTTPDLANGQHSVNVQAVDAAGNIEVATKLLKFNAAPPETTLDGPEGATKLRTPAYAVNSSRARSTFECKVDDDGAWAACDAAWTTPELMPGTHRVFARATDAAGNVDPTPAVKEVTVRDCVDKLTIGVLEAVGDCFHKNADGYYEADGGTVKVNGITFNDIGGRKLIFDPAKRKVSLGKVQLRVGGIVLYQGQLEYTVPEGDEVTLAKFDLETHSRTDAAPDDSEGSLDLQGDDSANVQGFDLKGEASLKLLKGGKALLSATIELPKVFTDAEGNGLTGAIQVASDNVRGVHLQGIQVKAPLAFMGKIEVHNLFLNFNGERNGDAKATCNADSPGLRWDGGADKVVLPTKDKLTIESVGLGFADGAFSYVRGSLNWADGGKSIGGGIKVQKIGISVCAGDPLKVEGRIGLTALPGEGGEPRLKIPDAGLLFTGGDPWTLRAEAPTAVLKLDRDYNFKDVFVQYQSSGAIDFGARLAFAIGLKGTVPLGSLDASVAIDAGVAGWIQGGKFNADIDAKGCFSGKFTVVDTLPVNIPKDICPTVTGVVSSKGIALCGSLVFDGKNIGGVGAGYEWGGSPRFMAGTCDVKDWRETRPGASAAAAGGKTVRLPGGQRGVLVAVRGIGAAPEVELRGPGGAVLRSAPDTNEAVRTKVGLAFANRAERTTYVVLAQPRGGRWSVKAVGDTDIAEVKTAGLRPAPAVRGSVSGKGRDLKVSYRVGQVKGQRVTFQEIGRGVSRTVATARGARGSFKLRPADGPGGRRRVVALVEQNGLPRKRITVATFKAPARVKPAKPAKVTLSTGKARAAAAGDDAPGARAAAARRAPLTITWKPAKRAVRYGVRVALEDGRRLFFLRDADDRVVRIPDAPAGAVSVRVVGLRADNGAGPAATANTNRRD